MALTQTSTPRAVLDYIEERLDTRPMMTYPVPFDRAGDLHMGTMTLPLDLTPEEALRIAQMVAALALED